MPDPELERVIFNRLMHALRSEEDARQQQFDTIKLENYLDGRVLTARRTNVGLTVSWWPERPHEDVEEWLGRMEQFIHNSAGDALFS